MSPVEYLRAAATLLRKTASTATPGPWTMSRIPGIGRTVDDPEGRLCIPLTQWISDADGAWIALVSPAAAEPLAAGLEAAATYYEDDHRFSPPGWTCDCWETDPILVNALALARTILGETA